MVVYMDTDTALNINILKARPIPGPIILEYFYGNFKSEILDVTYGSENYARPQVGIDVSIHQYWSLINSWRFPTQYTVFKWVRDMIRHIICMHERFNTLLGPLENPEFMFGHLKQMTGFVQDFDEDNAKEMYALVLRESGIRVAVRDVLALFEKSKIRRVDIREANPEFIRVLNAHIAHNVQSQLISLNLQEKVDVPGVILSERYRDAFYKDGLGQDTNRWLRYPSNFWAKGTRMLADNLSPATIRKHLAVLEEKGYLRQPHTSAGRIPTDEGYRAYVKEIGECGGVTPSEAVALRLQVEEAFRDGRADEIHGQLAEVIGDPKAFRALLFGQDGNRP